MGDHIGLRNRYKNGSDVASNEYLEELLAETIDRVANIDERTGRHTEILKELTGLSANLSSLNMNTAANTSAIGALNATLGEVKNVMSKYQEADQEKWNTAVGKNQIPLWSHYAVVLTLCFIMLAATFAYYRIDLKTKHLELTNVVREEHNATQAKIDKIEKKVDRQEEPIKVQEPVRVQIENNKPVR